MGAVSFDRPSTQFPVEHSNKVMADPQAADAALRKNRQHFYKSWGFLAEHIIDISIC
jgi:hypothetical protein